MSALSIALGYPDAGQIAHQDCSQGCGFVRMTTVTADKPAEFKQVTVLFADVVHSMDIDAAVGSERLRELMSELLDRFSVVVQRPRRGP
jgi:class 3 adenylate cyclase